MKMISGCVRAVALMMLSVMALLSPVTGQGAPKYEMRGLWVATVYGIDWPSKAGNTKAVADAQKEELIKLLDMAKDAGFNSVLLQVRPMADALYKSSYEPWSAYLTGGRGVAPADGWDPLAFAVEQAHKRGIELHAWVNPFRFSTSATLPSTAPDRKVIDKGWVLTHAQKTKGAPAKPRKGKNGKRTKAPAATVKKVSILDPGNPEVREYIVKICREIVTKYDIDGLVFDDYFYPEKFPVPDGVDPQEEGDRRRGNVAKAIAQVYEMIQDEKPWVRFGVAPAGVAGGNGRATAEYGLQPPSTGNDWMYDDIYCDPLKWLSDGSVDYVSPQLYWPSDHPTNPYGPLTEWWTGIARHFNRHLFVSQNVPSLPAGDAAWREQRREVEINRRASASDGIPSGQIFYSAAHLSGRKAQGLARELSMNEYSTPALMPPMPWKISDSHLEKVRNLSRKENRLSWYDTETSRYVCYAIPYDVGLIDALSDDGVNFDSKYIIGVTYDNNIQIPVKALNGHWFAVAPYDRYGNEGEAATLDAPQL